MNISVIVITKDRPKQLQQCLQEINQQSFLPTEVVVVDSSELKKIDLETAGLELSYELKHELILDVSIPYSRNYGLKRASENLVAFIDDDCHPSRDWLKTMAKAHQNHPRAAIVGGKVKNHDAMNIWGETTSSILTFYNQDPNKFHREEFLLTSNLSLKKNKLKDVFFDENLIGIEDVDFCNTAKSFGLSSFYDPAIEVTHDNRATLKEFLKQWYFYGRANHYFYNKYSWGLKRHAVKEIGQVFQLPAKLWAPALLGRLAWLAGLLAERTKSKFKPMFVRLMKKSNELMLLIPVRLKKGQSIGFPKDIFIEPTNNCNAACPLCPTGSGQLKRARGFISRALYKKIIDEVVFRCQTLYLWNMGEPFLHPHIFELIRYAKKQGIFTMSSTNGYALRSLSQVRELVDSKLDRLIVGIDGMDQDTYARYRKNLKLKDIIAGLRYLKKIKQDENLSCPKVDFQFIVMRHNQGQLAAARDLAKELDMNFRPKFLSLEMVNASDPEDWLPDKDALTIYQKERGKYRLKKKKINSACVAWNGMVINWDGLVNPCIFDYYGKNTLGDLNQQTVSQVWAGAKFTEFRRKVINNRNLVTICRDCPIEQDYSEEFLEK
ncbi:MAG: glycosyltransferase [Patescibacteria group bacterium]|nr:glycosyltransferase [Patescibacteria group bacterium]